MVCWSESQALYISGPLCSSRCLNASSKAWPLCVVTSFEPGRRPRYSSVPESPQRRRKRTAIQPSRAARHQAWVRYTLRGRQPLVMSARRYTSGLMAPLGYLLACPSARWRARWSRCGSSQQISKKGRAGRSIFRWPVHFDGATWVLDLNADIRRCSLRICSSQLHGQRNESRLQRRILPRV